MAKAAVDLEKLQTAIDKQTWRHSNLKGPHEYITNRDNPNLFARLTETIRQNPTKRRFQGILYTYFILNGYRYWKIKGIINRAKEALKMEQRLMTKDGKPVIEQTFIPNWRRRIKKLGKCETCGKPFLYSSIGRPNARFCSKKCMNEWRRKHVWRRDMTEKEKEKTSS